ncbi:MAG: M16 family metallopeptidase, partial [Candidatus Nanoarchaeia archaeon]
TAMQIKSEIERNGGELNGFTDENITAYWAKMPSKKVNVALDVLSDMVKNPAFDKKEMEKERKVIFEEMKMRKDNPRVYVFDKIQSFLYKEPLGIDLIGTEKTMNFIDRKKILSKFKEVYAPNNMVLVVVGDADFSNVVKYAEKTFGNEKGKVPEHPIKLKNESKLEKRKGVDQANLVLAFHSPLANDKMSYASKVLMTLMAGGMSSRLFEEIRDKRNLAYAVKGDTNTSRDYSYNFIYVGTTKDKVEEVKKLILEEFKKVARDLTKKELDEVKEQLIGNYQISMEDSQSQMVNLLGHEMDGDAKEFYDFEKHIKTVKLNDVKKLAKIKDYSFFALVPE